MTTKKLADTFMMDLDDLSDKSDDEINSKINKNNNLNTNEADFSKSYRNIRTAKLYTSSNLLTNTKFKEFLSKLEKSAHLTMNIIPFSLTKDSLIYQLISDSNKYISEITLDINSITKYIKEIYSLRFPELESLILNPYDYVIAVKKLGNHIDVNKVDLTGFLPNHNIMAINIMSSSTSGKPLSENELKGVHIACDEVIELNKQRKYLLNFIESRMHIIAPNLSEIVGSNIAAKLVTAAGGIIELSKMPACNVLVLGSQQGRKNLEGFSTSGKLHRGYLAELDLVKETPEDFQNQAIRMLASKCSLASRVDAYRKVDIKTTNENFKDNNFNESENDNTKVPENSNVTKEGEKLKEGILKRLYKIQQPQQPILKKVLPKPDDKPRKRRGGKRMRSIKKRYELTEMRKMKNRMKFGTDEEKEYRETGKGYGQLGVGGVGAKMKNAVKVGQKINTKKQKIATLKAGNETSGLCSSVAFTPVQGMELINPELLTKNINNVADKYFSTTSGFATVINSKKKNDSSFFEI